MNLSFILKLSPCVQLKLVDFESYREVKENTFTTLKHLRLFIKIQREKKNLQVEKKKISLNFLFIEFSFLEHIRKCLWKKTRTCDLNLCNRVRWGTTQKMQFDKSHLRCSCGKYLKHKTLSGSDFIRIFCLLLR